MTDLHPVLLNQLRRLGLDAGDQNLRAQLEPLMHLVSETYNEADEYRYAMERSLDIASEEIAFLGQLSQEKIARFSAVIAQAIIFATKDWQISESNLQAEQLIGKSLLQQGEALQNGQINFLNLKKKKLDLNKLTDYFDCGQRYQAPKITLVTAGETPIQRMINLTIVPLYKEGQLHEFALLIEDMDAPYAQQIREQISRLIASVFAQFDQTCLKNNLKALMKLSLDNDIYLSLLSRDTDEALEHFYRQSMYGNFAQTTQVLDYINTDLSPNIGRMKGFHFASLADLLAQAFKTAAEFAATQIQNQVPGYIEGNLDDLNCFLTDMLSTSIYHFKPLQLAALQFDLKKSVFGQGAALLIKTAWRGATEFVANDSLIALEQSLKESASPINEIRWQRDETSIQLEFELGHFRHWANDHRLQQDNPLLRILVYTENNSLLHRILQQHPNLDHIQFQTVSNQLEMASLFKMARLEQREYHLIFTDKDDLFVSDSSLMYEIRSFISPNFMGFYLFSNFKRLASQDHHKVEVHNIVYADLVKNYLIMMNRLYVKLLGKNYVSKLSGIDKFQFNRDVLYLSPNHEINFALIELMIATGIVPTCIWSIAQLHQSMQVNPQAVIIDLNQDIANFNPDESRLLTELIAAIPSLLLLNEASTANMQFVEKQRLCCYLIKPFSLQQFVQGLDDLLQSKQRVENE